MKDDFMENEQLKAGHNLQHDIEAQYALAHSIFPNSMDTPTLLPFLNQIEEYNHDLLKQIAADARYGSEQNSDNILSKCKREAVISFSMYVKEKKKKYKQNEFRKMGRFDSFHFFRYQN